MDTQQAIRGRRAVKHFDPSFVMPAAEELELRALLREAPSSFNIQHCRYVIVRNPALRQDIRAAAWNQAQVTEASLLFVLCADVNAWDKAPERYWQNADASVRDYLVPAIRQFYHGREWQARDEALRSVGIAAQTLMLAAQDLGYDSCPMIGFDADTVGRLVNLPDGFIVGLMVAVGKGTQAARPKGGYLPDDEVFIENRFPGT